MPLLPNDVKGLNIPSKVSKHLLTRIALYVLLACCQFCQLVPGDMAGWNPEKSTRVKSGKFGRSAKFGQ